MIGSHVKWKGQWNGLLGKWTDSRDYPVGPFVLPGLQAYYDTSDASSLVYDSAGRVSLFMDKSGNSQSTCFVSNVAASNSLSAPTKSVLGSQLFSLDVGLDDYTPGSDVTIASKISGNDGFAIQVLTTGVVRLRIGDGVSVTNVDSTASLSIADMVRGTIGIIWADGIGASFTQNGAALGVPVAAVKTLTNAAVAMTVGTITGRIYRFTALGFYDCNPAGANRGSSSFASGGDTWTLATSGATGARISGERDLYQGTVANQPVYLTWTGTNYGWLNGVVGNYFSTPDSAASSITGDIDLRAYCSFNNIAPSSFGVILGKFTVATSQRSYILFQGNTGGQIGFASSVNGASSITSYTTVSLASIGVAAYSPVWIRVTCDVNNGSGGNTVTFYHSTDGTNWSLFGAPVVNVGTTSIFDSSSPVELGSQDAGTSNPFSGSIYRAQIYNGIGGTLVADFNPSLYVSGPTFVASTGETWTVQGGAHIVVRTGLYGDGSNDYLKSAAFALVQPTSLALVLEQVSWTINDYITDGGSVDTLEVYQQTATPRLATYSGATLGGNTDLAVKTAGVVSLVANGASSSLRVNRLAALTGNSGAVAANGFTLGAQRGGSAPANIFVSEVAVYSTALSPASQDAIALYEGRKWRFTV